MKEELSSLDLYYLMSELKELVGGRIDKIYQKDRDFLITMHIPSKGKRILKILPNALYLTQYKESFDTHPPGFCTFLRKHLGNTTITDISQKSFERIVLITLETFKSKTFDAPKDSLLSDKGKKFFMIIELFGKGNLVLCDENMKIMSALESHRWRDRTIRGGLEYESPEEQTNTPEISKKDFEEIVKGSELESIVKVLAIEFALGGLYAEEVCFAAKIDKNKKDLNKDELNKVYDSLKSLLKRNLKPCVAQKEILPFKLESLEADYKYFETFSLAIDSVLSVKILKKNEMEAEKKHGKAVEKIQKIVDQQELTIKGLEKSSKANQQKGEFIYEHYEQIKNILKEFNIARKKYSWDELKEMLKKSKLIKNIDEKNGLITLDL